MPFFGDQPFWGDCCLRAGVGPKPVPIGRLSNKVLMHAFETFDLPEVRSKAREVAEAMNAEDGRTAAVEHFHWSALAPVVHKSGEIIISISQRICPTVQGFLYLWVPS